MRVGLGEGGAVGGLPGLRIGTGGAAFGEKPGGLGLGSFGGLFMTGEFGELIGREGFGFGFGFGCQLKSFRLRDFSFTLFLFVLADFGFFFFPLPCMLPHHIPPQSSLRFRV